MNREIIAPSMFSAFMLFLLILAFVDEKEQVDVQPSKEVVSERRHAAWDVVMKPRCDALQSSEGKQQCRK